MTLRALVSTSHSPSRWRAASPSSRARTASRAASPCVPGPIAAVTSDEGEVAEAKLDEATSHEILIDQPPRPGGIDIGRPEPLLEESLATRPAGSGRPRLGPLVGRRLEAEPHRLPDEKPSIHVALDIRRLEGARRWMELEEPERPRDRDVARRHEGAVDVGHDLIQEADVGVARQGDTERAEDGEEAQRRSHELRRSLRSPLGGLSFAKTPSGG
jgi:hypothetical protein